MELLKSNEFILEPSDNLNAPYYMIEGANSSTCDIYNNLYEEDKKKIGFAGFKLNYNLDIEKTVDID